MADEESKGGGQEGGVCRHSSVIVETREDVDLEQVCDIEIK